MEMFIVVLSLVGATACSDISENVKPIDLADAGTTAVIIAQGGVEMNPVIGVAGNAASPLVAIAVKSGLRYTMRGVLPEGVADHSVDLGGYVGTCNNLAVLAGVATFPTSLIYGAACGLGYHIWWKADAE